MCSTRFSKLQKDLIKPFYEEHMLRAGVLCQPGNAHAAPQDRRELGCPKHCAGKQSGKDRGRQVCPEGMGETDVWASPCPSALWTELFNRVENSSSKSSVEWRHWSQKEEIREKAGERDQLAASVQNTQRMGRQILGGVTVTCVRSWL